MIRRPPRSTLFPYTDALPILAQRYVLAASGLKRSKLTELARLLDEQLQSARGNLQRAEAALEQFRTRTITLPPDPGATGTAAPPKGSPLGDFFDLQVEQGQLRRDQQAITQALDQMRGSSASVEGLGF